jgi:hypothetical protein
VPDDDDVGAEIGAAVVRLRLELHAVADAVEVARRNGVSTRVSELAEELPDRAAAAIAKSLTNGHESVDELRQIEELVVDTLRILNTETPTN